jgi:hypothetical protein
MTAHQHHDPSPSPVPPISSSGTCPNGLEDGSYLFRSYSKQSWSVCGASGSGSRELSFLISGCECHAGVDREVCADDITLSSLAPIPVPPSMPHHLSDLHCSASEYFFSSTDTCLLITLSDQYGDGWTSGDGSENAWLGYSFSSSNGHSSAVTYHSLNCSCPRMIGCLSPSSFAFAAGDQTIDLAIYSNEDSPVAFSWEIMYLVQVIQNGRLLDSHHGGYRTHMEFSYSHSSGTLSLSSKTDGAPGNGDAVDMSRCEELPVVGLVSDLSLEGWSIVDNNSNKQETIAWRNPSCVHTLPMLPGSSVPHLPVARSKGFVQEKKDSPFDHQSQDSFSFPTVTTSSRRLAGELVDVGSVTTLAGVAGSSGSPNGIGTNAEFNGPSGVTISPDGVYVLVADRYNHLIRHIVISTASVTTLAGGTGSDGSTNGIGTNVLFNNPLAVSISPDGVYALVADYGNHLIRHIDISTTFVTTLAGVAGSSGSTNGVGTIATLNSPIGVCISPDEVYALVAERHNHLIRLIIISTASVTTLAGVAGSTGSTNGFGTNAKFNQPYRVSISPDGVYALVTDYLNHLIRRIVISTTFVTTLAGVAGSSGSTNGIGTNAVFNRPYGVTISPDGVYALVGDQYNCLIRQINISTATVTTLAGVAESAGSTNGIGTNAQFNQLYEVSISRDGVFGLVADNLNQLIRQIIMRIGLPTVAPSASPSATPTVAPSASPSHVPSFGATSLPSVPPITRFSFGVKIGDEGILSPGKAILVDYLQDPRRGWSLPSPLSQPSLSSSDLREDDSHLWDRQRL